MRMLGNGQHWRDMNNMGIEKICPIEMRLCSRKFDSSYMSWTRVRGATRGFLVHKHRLVRVRSLLWYLKVVLLSGLSP